MKGSERCFLSAQIFGAAMFAGNLHVANGLAALGILLMVAGAVGFVWPKP